MKDLVLTVTFLVTISGSLGLLANRYRSTPVPILTAYGEGKPVTMQELRQMKRLGAIVVDARERVRYQNGHLPGAINVPVDDFAKNKNDLGPLLVHVQSLVVYCESSQCSDARRLIGQWMELGAQEPYIFEGGFQAWEAAGGEIVK